MSQETMKEAKMRFIKFIIWSATALSVSYLGYNLFSGEVMTTIDNWIATGTLTVAQAVNAGLIILTRVLPQSMSTQTSAALSPLIKSDNEAIKQELTEVRKENAEILALLLEQKEYRDNALNEEA